LSSSSPICKISAIKTSIETINKEVFKIFQTIVIRFLSNAIKYKSKVNLPYITNEEKKALDAITNYYPNIKILFSIREDILKNYELYKVINLDIMALIISTFERIKNVN
jgi:hypothetical protein